MGYSGTTAASSIANPPIQLVKGLGGGSRLASTAMAGIGTGLWFYGTTDVSSSAFASGYFSDGYELGMKTGDVVIISCFISTVTSSGTLTMGIVSSVSTTGGGTQLSSGSFMSST